MCTHPPRPRILWRNAPTQMSIPRNTYGQAQKTQLHSSWSCDEGKKTHSQGDIHNLMFHTKTKWNSKFAELRLAVYKVKHPQSSGILLLAPHSPEDILAGHTHRSLQSDHSEKHTNKQTNNSLAQPHPHPRGFPRLLQPKQSIFIGDLHSNSSTRHTSRTWITIVWTDAW